MAATNFSRWLDETLAAREMKVRQLARLIAEGYQGGATERNVETARRTLNKYRLEGRVPALPMRRAIAQALGVEESEIPSDSDEEADALRALTRDPGFLEALRPLARVLSRGSN